MSSSVAWSTSVIWRAFSAMFTWESIAPLGWPVVPEV